jgi:UDP-N-acetylglucosamine--N-acetylmuramyl-(pentapeptide) pyrophosphoryl-undecaprenol N-acetylglucosamine transferase
MKNLNRKIFKSSALISVGTLLTRLFGFIREILAAAYFGGGKTYDAFVVAFQVPNLFRRVLGEEMIERAFLPPFKRMLAENRVGKAKKFLFKTAMIVSVSSFVLTLLMYPFISSIIKLLAPGFSPESFATSVALAKILLPFLILISLSAFAGAILYFSGKSILYSTAPGIMNIIVIIFIIIYHSKLGVKSIAIAYLIGAAGFIFYQLPALIKILKNLKGSSEKTKTKEVKKSIAEAGKILFSSVISKGVQIVDTIVASLVGSGAISSLWYSFRLIQLPYSILSLSTSRGIAPELSKLRGKKDKKKFGEIINLGIDINLIVLTPIILFFMIFSKEIIMLFYKRGAFNQTNVVNTALPFFYYSLALLPMGFIGLLNRVYSALEDNKIPLISALTGGIINVLFDFMLYKTSLKHGGIALATAIALFIQVLILFVYLRKYSIKIKYMKIIETIAKVIFSFFFFIPTLVIFKIFLKNVSGFFSVLIVLSIGFILSFGIYAVIIYEFWRKRYSVKKRIILTGGGTGGHVYPSLAIYNILKKKNYTSEVLYLGIKGRAEEIIVPKHKIKIEYIKSSPFAGGSFIGKIKSLFIIMQGVFISIKKILKFRPHIIVATGGYVSAPVVMAGFILKPFLKLKIIVEEQNLVPGMLNKAASLLSDIVLVNCRETAYFIWSNRCIHAGYPVRKEYVEDYDKKEIRKKLGIPNNKFMVLVTGGSLGARSINRLFGESLKDFSRWDNIFIVHSIGLAENDCYNAFEDTKNILKQNLKKQFNEEEFIAYNKKGKVFYKGYKFLHNIVDYQKAADMIVSRGGAGGIAEIAALSKPSVIIPKRGLPGDHQELNAINIGEKGGADIIFEKYDSEKKIDYIDKKEFIKVLKTMVADKNKIKRIVEEVSKFHKKDSEKIIYDSIYRCVEGEYLDFISEIIEPKFVKFQRQFDSLILYLDNLVKDKGADNLYYRFYNIKIDDYINSDNFLVVNKGIKLIGSLRREDLYPWINKNFDSFKGFLKRNSLIALKKSENYFPFFKKLIKKGLSDSYYEVRREAIKFYLKFHKEIGKERKIVKKIKQMISSRTESFEVKSQAIVASVIFLNETEFIEFNERFLYARNIRLREALLEAIEFGIKNGFLTDKKRVKTFVKKMLITTSEFKPEFRVRGKYMRVIREVSKRDD